MNPAYFYHYDNALAYDLIPVGEHAALKAKVAELEKCKAQLKAVVADLEGQVAALEEQLCAPSMYELKEALTFCPVGGAARAEFDEYVALLIAKAAV